MHSRKVSLGQWCLAALMMFMGGLHSAVADCRLRILPFGDSITYGLWVDGGYRPKLFQLLTDAGYSVDFLGTQTEFAGADLPDPDHEGHNAWRIDQLDGIVDHTLASIADPDVILLMIGVNDYFYNYLPDTAPKRFDALITHIATNRPAAKIIVANLLPCGVSTVNTAIENSFNPMVPVTCSNQAAMGRQVYFNDAHSALEVSDLFDGLHPSAFGYLKLATNWFQAVTNIVPPLGMTNFPSVSRVHVGRDSTNVVLTFNKPMADNVTNLANYTVTGGLLLLNSGLDAESRQILSLHTTPQAPEAAYTLGIANVQDSITGQAICPETTVTFHTPPLDEEFCGTNTIVIAPVPAKCVGESVTLAAFAGGPGPVAYAWSKDGVLLPGQTDRLLTITNITAADAGTYSVIVGGACNGDTSFASLEVNALTSAAGPSSLTNCAGSVAVFEAVASGTGPFAYQWSKDGMDLADATNSTYSIAPAGPADAGNYCVVVTGNCNSVTNCASLAVNEAASATGPIDVTACPGATASFCTVASGSGPFSYQWCKGSTILSGETNDCLVLTNVTIADAGTYCVKVTGSCISLTNCATLTVLTNTVASGPSAALVCPGEAATFCTIAAGTGPFTYQWCKWDAPLAGETNDCLTLTNVSEADAGSYCVKVTGVCNSVTNCATLTVATNLTTIGPIDQSACPGSAVTFCTIPDGVGPFGYQWTKEGIILGGETNQCLNISNVATGSAGVYGVEVTRACFSVTNYASLTVLSETAATPLASVTNACQGSAVTFSTIASGSGPFTYQWSKDGTDLSEATNNSYTITAVTPADVGTYCVRVSGACNTVTNCASLTVDTMSVTGLVSQLSCPGSAAVFEVVASGTGPFAYQWSKDGTDLVDATNSAYSIASAGPADVGNYCVVVTGNCLSLTNCASLTIREITSATGPVDVAACPGTTASLCTVASGSGPFTYQWCKGNTILVGETNDCLALTNITTADAGAYCVKVTGCCTAVTNCATLTLLTNTTARGLSDAWACPGEAVTFCTVAAGTGPFTYQWYKSDTPLTGETNDCLMLANLSESDGSSYCVKVTGACNSVTNCVLLTIATSITANGPDDQTACPGSAVTLCTVTDGAGPYTFQWTREGIALVGETNSCLTVSNISSADAGAYGVEVTRACYSVTNYALLTVLIETATAPLASITNVCPGETVGFAAAATTGGPFTCQWSKDGTAIANATNSTYTIDSVTTRDAGLYSVRIRGACNDVTSSATLTVAATAITGARYLTNGDFELSFRGPTGYAYELLSSERVTAPASEWVVVTNGIFVAGPMTFVDIGATDRFTRFFHINLHCQTAAPPQ